MELWINEIMNKLNRRKTPIIHSQHIIKDKISSIEELDSVEETVKFGKVDEDKSTKEKQRICLKLYFKKPNQTYFVIVEYYPDSIKTITAITKVGKY